MSLYAIVVISLFVFCIFAGVVIGIRKFVEWTVTSLRNVRNEDYYKEEYTVSVIKRKYGKKAADIMRDAYSYYLSHKKKMSDRDKYKLFANAYKKALNLVSKYIDEDESDYIANIPYFHLGDYSGMYRKFFGSDIFDPYEKIRYTLK